MKSEEIQDQTNEAVDYLFRLCLRRSTGERLLSFTINFSLDMLRIVASTSSARVSSLDWLCEAHCIDQSRRYLIPGGWKLSSVNWTKSLIQRILSVS